MSIKIVSDGQAPRYPIRETENVTIDPPPERETGKATPLIQRILTTILPVLMVSVIIIMIVSGSRQMGVFMVMMVVSMFGMAIGKLLGDGDNGETEANRRFASRQLNQERPRVHKIGRAQHMESTMNFPNVAAIPSLVEANDKTFWSVVREPQENDPPRPLFLGARLGQGNVRLDPAVTIDGKTLTPDALDPAVVDSVARFMSVHNLLPAPVGIELSDYAMGWRYETPNEASLAAGRRLAESMILSLAYTHSPNNLHIGCITSRPKQWDWIKWLPHSENTFAEPLRMGLGRLFWSDLSKGTFQSIADLSQAASSGDDYFLIVVDSPDEEIAVPRMIETHPAGLIDSERTVINNVIFLVINAKNDRAITKPDQRLLIHENGMVSMLDKNNVAKIDDHTAEDVALAAKAMSNYRPNNYGQHGAVLDEAPTESVEAPKFLEALGVPNPDEFDVQEHWFANDRKHTFRTPIGYAVDKNDRATGKVVHLDIAQQSNGGSGPHGMFIGLTGTGKSFLLQCFILSLICNYSPRRLNIIAGDFKGAATFSPFRNAPHFLAVLSNLEAAQDLVIRAKEVIEGELQRRLELFDEYGAADIDQYRRLQEGNPDMPDIPLLLIVFDEFREFIVTNPDFKALLDRVTAIGRAIGVYQLIGSQYIDQTMIGQSTEENGRSYGIALKVNKPQHSQLAIDSPEAASLPPKYTALLHSIENGQYTLQRYRAFNHARKLTLHVYDQEQQGDVPHDQQKQMFYVTPFSLESCSATGSSKMQGESAQAPNVPESREVEAIETKETEFQALLRAIEEKGKNYTNVTPLWLRPMREPVTLSSVPQDRWGVSPNAPAPKFIVGWVDDPYNRDQYIDEIDLSGTNGSLLIEGDSGSGRSNLFRTMVASSALRYTGNFVSFFLYEHNGSTLADVEGFPNVAMYGARTESDKFTRMKGEIDRLMRLRNAAFRRYGLRVFEDYLAQRGELGIKNDPFGHIVWIIDGLDSLYEELAEEDFEIAQWFIEVIQNGAGLGIHLVGTTTGRVQKMMKLNSCFGKYRLLKLADPSMSATVRQNDARAKMQQLPSNDPGRGLDLEYKNGRGQARLLENRTLLPFEGIIEPDSFSKGLPIYVPKRHSDAVRALGENLNKRAVPSPKLREVPGRIALANVFESYGAAGLEALRNRRAISRPLAIGALIATDQVAEVLSTTNGRHLIVTGERQSGKTNALAAHMEAVRKTFTPDEARIMVLDSVGSLYGAHQAAMESDHSSQNAYIRSRNNMADLLSQITEIAASRVPRPGEEHLIPNREYFAGSEYFIYIDGLRQFLAPNSYQVGNQPGTLEALVDELVRAGADLGIHIIASMGDATAVQDFTNPRALAARIVNDLAGDVMLLGSKQPGAIVHGAKFNKTARPGRAQLVQPRGVLDIQLGLADTTLRNEQETDMSAF